MIIQEGPAIKSGFGYERRRGMEERKTSILRDGMKKRGMKNGRKRKT
jgi:hypothetical protein